MQDGNQERVTPALRQYLTIKAQYPDTILFFRMGDFYEMFFDDAHVASRILNIALTTRDKATPMCGIPYHSASPYIKKLVDAGYKVAICEQVEDPKKARGLVRREVIRVITPGLLTELENLDPAEGNFILTCTDTPEYSVAYADISTGEFFVDSFDTEDDFLDEIGKISPKEVIASSKELADKLRKKLGVLTTCPALSWKSTKLKLELPDSMSRCAGALVEYVRENIRDVEISLDAPRIPEHRSFMQIDPKTLKNLEVFETLSGRHGSLIWVVDRTKTPMGKRLLKRYLKNPLLSPDSISERLSAVEELINIDMEGDLENIQDLERLAIRLRNRTITPKELLVLASSLKFLPTLKDVRSKILVETKFDDFSGFISEVEKHIDKNGEIKPEVSDELLELVEIRRNTERFLREYEERERKATCIPLKIGYNKVFGYYIEVTKSYISKVPNRFKRKQTLVGAERFTTLELEELEAKIISADEKIKSLSEEIYRELLAKLSEWSSKILKCARDVARIDVLYSFAETAKRFGWVKPEVTDSFEIKIEDGRHPAVELTLKDEKFVPNPTYITPSSRILIITGPNMSGKSTHLRQVALIVLLAQAGSFVPAKEAKIGAVDRIFVRAGATDDISRGRSTFFTEMEDASYILRSATERSLIILDEVGRGTATFDGISVAWAICEYIHNKLKARCLFATHFHELAYLEEILESFENWHFGAREWGNSVVFLRKLTRGASSRSYGVQVARLAGLPEEIISRAKRILADLEEGEIAKILKNSKYSVQLSLFSKDKLKDRLKTIDINRITPMDALKILEELKGLAE